MTPADNAAPPAAARWGGWATAGLGFIVAVVFVLLQTATFLLVLKARGLAGPALQEAFAASADNGRLLSLATLVSTVVGCTMVAAFIKLKRGADLREYLALHAVRPRTMLAWTAAVAVLVATWDATAISLGRPVVSDFMRSAYASADPEWLFWLALVIAAPLFEEVFVRGFLLAGFARSALRPAGAVVVTAALWASIHLQYDAFDIAFIFVLGVVLGAARLLTGSLLVPLGLHALGNLGATIETALLR